VVVIGDFYFLHGFNALGWYTVGDKRAKL